MEKYQRVPRERDPMGCNEIRVSATGPIKSYLNDASKMLGRENMRSITIKATGKAIARAVTTAEVIKRRIKGLHQLTRVGSIPITDTYEPLEEGLDKVIHERIVSFLEVHLSKDPLDEKDPGYQSPLDDSEMKDASNSPRANRGRFRDRNGRGQGYYGRGFVRGGRGRMMRGDGIGYRGSDGGGYRDGGRGGLMGDGMGGGMMYGRGGANRGDMSGRGRYGMHHRGSRGADGGLSNSYRTRGGGGFRSDYTSGGGYGGGGTRGSGFGFLGYRRGYRGGYRGGYIGGGFRGRGEYRESG